MTEQENGLQSKGEDWLQTIEWPMEEQFTNNRIIC
jgi:hypothetical protein